MDDVRQAAREESRRRYSVPRQNTFAVQVAFMDGAEWQAMRDAEQPVPAVTDEMIEAACRIYSIRVYGLPLRELNIQDANELRRDLHLTISAALSAKGGGAAT